ncbi:MAG: acyl carrier protein [Gammaproteobacteria bacterium]|uniref:acyl carrier protein n=1 Tax=Rhodoferax sp. TaxID=50421 RepID=UPI00179CE139|nr:phosphopantetheine-binding protein [Rhodoferax sp.]MBU3898564.1 acyl carrier protein [Gammaproteobacteria bacterium]MBA3059822.1 acyl carrier protein [Rhodoferax sp.]MBU3997891.1 acyl carrier protein [Gammaproteobacteria bacterium]MBU4079339.1 acyl carrier protein [Gammaproteobacteria bacterium]MBU4113198.1 acyl carrier protein [Gammaproteobacteria bacterium]
MSTERPTLMATVVALLRAIAPEVEPDTLAPARALRQQVDLDSMDWLNFLVSLHEHFGVTIPEADYAGLVSLDNVVDYLQARLK